jgi:hypothetical protein
MKTQIKWPEASDRGPRWTDRTGNDHLKEWLSSEIAEAEALRGERKGMRWNAVSSRARCDGCGGLKARCTIGAHPASPFYLCEACGTVERFVDISK